MPARLPPSFGDVYAAVAADLKGQLGDATAQRAGVPLDVPVVPATEQDRIDAWSTPHPDATDAAMLALAEQKYAEHRQNGMDDPTARRAVAEDLTHFRYRARQPLYSLGTTSSAEQVKEAERLAKSSAASAARRGQDRAQAAETAQPAQPAQAAAPSGPPDVPPDVPPMSGGNGRGY